MLFRPLASLLLLAAAVQATLPFGGVCLSGLELGISTKGAVRGAYKAPDVTQISHFVGLGANLIRIPVAWHYLVGGKIGGELDATYCALVDSYVQAALSASADCEVLLELDTFGGFGGKALGQGFVSIDAYADLWAKLSARYAGQARVSFSLRNSVSGNSRLWASACQAAVAKIRASGCVSNKIALGLGGGGLIQGLLGLWGSAMLSVKDTISLTDGLVFDISSFLDGGALGVSGLCLGSNSLAIGAMHSWLSLHKRRAFLHTGGGSNDNCARFLGSGLATLEAHSSSFLGFTIAGAGAVSGGLSIAPRASGKDCSLVSQVIAPRFPHFGVGVSAGVGAGASASAGAGASLNASVGLPAVSAGVGASLGASAALPAASASVSAGTGAAPSASGAVAAGGSVSPDLSTSVRVNLPSLGGVVLSGLEFGIDAKGSLTGGLTGYSAPDVKQIAHFVSLGSNLIRLPLGWKYLVAGGVCGASELEASYLALIDTYVKASLAASADCRILLDLDTFGHFGGVAVGTGDITIDKLASVYGLLAAKYKGEKRVLFGISNSFAGSVDVDLWAKACQAAVVSIRAAGAVSSAITLGFGARAEFAGLLSIWGDALLGVKDSLNAAGGIAFDFSLFLDAKGAGVSSECSLDAKASVSAMHSWLGSHGRQAFISTGAGSNAKCVASLQLGLTEIKKSASILGFSIAGAGSVQNDFGLSIVPKGEADVDIVSQCIKPFLPQHCACEDTKVSKRRLDTEPTARRRQVQPHQERSRSH